MQSHWIKHDTELYLTVFRLNQTTDPDVVDLETMKLPRTIDPVQYISHGGCAI